MRAPKPEYFLAQQKQKAGLKINLQKENIRESLRAKIQYAA
jgi:hypothetical protein